ncbi:MAG: sugar phosphate isomerase/epimerase family protein, partial [Caldicoprobacterales bacterium]
MFKYGVTCSFEELPPQQPVTMRGELESLIQRAKACNYDALELFIRNPKQYDGSAVKAAVDAAGLSVSGITTGMEYTKNGLSLISDDASVRKQAVERLCEHIDLGAQLNSPVIVGIMRANIPDFNQYQMYEDRLSDALRQLSDYAAGKGVLIYVESIMRYINNYLN